MLRDYPDCVYDDSDEDCKKCSKRGIRRDCCGCKDYKPLYGGDYKENHDEEQ